MVSKRPDGIRVAGHAIVGIVVPVASGRTFHAAIPSVYGASSYTTRASFSGLAALLLLIRRIFML